MCFFFMSQALLKPKIRFLGQKMSSVAHMQTHRHKSEKRGHTFRVSELFPSTYHQGSIQKCYEVTYYVMQIYYASFIAFALEHTAFYEKQQSYDLQLTGYQKIIHACFSYSCLIMYTKCSLKAHIVPKDRSYHKNALFSPLHLPINRFQFQNFDLSSSV